jgi:hypothetical protein
MPNVIQRRHAVSPLKIKIPIKNMHEKPTNTPIFHSVYLLCMVVATCFGIILPSPGSVLSTAPQLSISQKALGMLPEDGNVMPKHVRATIHK